MQQELRVNRRVVAVVGGAGLVGSALTDRLINDGHRVLVVDRSVPRRAVRHLRADLLQLPRSDLAAWLRAAHVDVVVHLVARVDPPGDAADRELMRRLHDEGTRTVADAAKDAGVSRFVLVSSAVVYGAWPDNPVPLTEDAPVRPCPFPYAEDKAMQEALVVDRWGHQGLTIVRPAIIYGRTARSYLTEILRKARLPLLRRGILPALDGHRPPLQFVHVDDVAAVIAAVVAHDVVHDVAHDVAHDVNGLDGLDGVFHACASDWLAFDEVARLAGLVTVDVNAAVVGAVLDGLVPFLPPWLRAPSSLFPYLLHPFVLSAAKTRRVLGVQTSSSAQALATLFVDPS